MVTYKLPIELYLTYNHVNNSNSNGNSFGSYII